MSDPFSLVPVPNEGRGMFRTLPGHYHAVMESGHVGLFKRESGVDVLVQDLGTAKNYVEGIIHNIGLRTLRDLEGIDEGDLTHIEITVLNLYRRSASGDIKAITEVLDRILGKAKQVNENSNLNLTLEDVLKGVPERN